MENKKKNPIVIGIGAAIAGALITVAAIKFLPSKDTPAPAAEQAASEAPADLAAAPNRPTRPQSIDRDTADASSGEAGGDSPLLQLDEIDSETQEEVRNVMRDQQMKRFTEQAARWSAALGLDQAQQEQLMDIAEAQLEELEKIAVDAADAVEGEDLTGLPDAARRAMDIVSGKALESSLNAMLTPEQREKFEEFGARQNQSRAEVQAMRQLAGIQQELMLSPEQRNAVYAAYYEDAMVQIDNDSGMSSAIEAVASSAGISVDPAVQNMIAALADRGLEELATGRPLDPDALEEMARTSVGQSLEQQVERMRGVLNDAQLEIYRGILAERMTNLTGIPLAE